MELRDSRVYYGTCSTAASESEKVVEVLNPVFIDGQNNRLDLMVGDILVVKLDNGNTTSNPTIKLRVKGDNQNISVSADAGLTTLINERYDWAPQEIMAFACVYCGPINEGEDPINSYAWKPIELPIASDDTYGVTKLVNNENVLTDTDERPVGYKLIKQKIGDAVKSLKLNYSDGNLVLADNDGEEISQTNIPIPPTKTSQLTNDGEPREPGEENTEDRYWSSRTNNYVMKFDLGIGYPYIEDNQQKIIKSIEPYGTIESGDKTAHVIRIGRDALKAYQNGVKPDGSDDLLEIDPQTRLYGNKIDFLIDSNGSVGIGACNISEGHNDYTRGYIFEPNKVTFKQDLNITNNKKLASKYIEYNGTELENRLTNFYIKSYVTDVLSYPSADDGGWKSIATNCEKYRPTECTKSKSGASLWFEITNLPTGYVPIGIVGYNLDEANVDSITSTPSRMIMWECWLVNKSNKYYFQCALTNSDHKKNSIKINYKVLFVKERLVN